MSARREARQKDILDAARKVIIDVGLEATTLRKISVAGGFTTGVVMHHFPDKTSVINATFADMSDEWVDLLEEELAATGSVEERLGVLVNHGLPSDPERQKVWRMWVELFSLAAQSDEVGQQMMATDVRWEADVLSVTSQCARAGLLTTPDVGSTAYALTRLMDGLALRAHVSGDWEGQRARLVAALGLLGFAQQAVDAVEGTS